MYSATTAAPVVVEFAVAGLGEVVEEAVVGSKMILRCVSIALLVITAVLMVRLGRWACFKPASTQNQAMSKPYRRAPAVATLDPHAKRYGGRLKGGLRRVS